MFLSLVWILYTARSLVGKGPRPKPLEDNEQEQEDVDEDEEGGVVLEDNDEKLAQKLESQASIKGG